MKSSPRRIIILMLALLIAFTASSGASFGVFAARVACAGSLFAAEAGPRPVVIIDGASLGRYLESVGYERGKNLFEVDPGDPQDLETGAMILSEAVKEHLRGAPECDVVASGIWGLIARYALEKGYMEGLKVKNLVMAAVPNRGTFLAGVVKWVLELVRQESILERETRLERFVPSLKDIFGDDAGPASLKELTSAKALRPPEWEDEASWIYTRSSTLWEPLYAEYVKNRFFALPYVPVQSPKETFAGWVSRTLPEVWKRLFLEAQWPDGSKRDLSLPYYEFLAMEVAKNQYVMRTASQKSLASSLLKDPIIPKDWKEAVVHYGTKVLLHFAEKAAISLKAYLQELIAREAVKLTGLGTGPESPFISGLIKEDILINLGSSSSKRFERIPANLALGALNLSSQSRAARRETRYVSVVSRLANPWAAIWPELGPNDSLLEVDCAIPPVSTGDLITVFGGILRLPGKHILDDPRAQRYVAEVLLEEGRDGTGHAVEAGLKGDGLPVEAAPSLTALDVSSWRPVYFPVRGASKVTLGITSLPPGWQCQVWEERSDPGASPEGGCGTGTMWGLDRGGNYTLLVSPDTVRLGFRLLRSGPLNPIEGNAVGSAFAREEVARVFAAWYRDEARPTETPESGARHPETPGTGSAGENGVPGDSPPDGPSGGGGDGELPPPPVPAEEAGLPAEEPGLPDDLPVVRVVYRSKHTTLKKPKETFHDHWVMDFGDGLRETVQGEVFLEKDHTFDTPGDYRVTAESYTGEGKLLYRKIWQVRVVLPGETHRFVCESIAPPEVEVTLNGPKMWVTGKVAVFSVGARVDLPRNAELIGVKFDPGEMFGVVWERAGDFVVGAAALVTVRYHLEDVAVEVENVYLKEVPVTVLTTGVTQ